MTKYAINERYIRVGGVTMSETAAPKQLAIAPAPLAEWEFTQTAAPFTSTDGDLPLSQGHATALVTRAASPWGYSASLPSGGAYLKLDAASVGRLNIGASGGNQVTVAAWVYQTDADIGFVAGIWPETGFRSYGLFGHLPSYGGSNRVCMHVSKTGNATPGYPASIDYSASFETYARNAWRFFVGTYDGAQMISYVSGKGTAYPTFTDAQGATYSKNPYLFDDGLNATPADFTVGAVRLSGGMSNFLTGQIAKLRVWDVALTPQEIQALYNDEVTALP